ncbi:general transcription factor II-I repeat domain-containing protein 2-like isoform X3 [Eriocheir sinensis]|uniref:general transcription factor II-I repeat domain-containing protein 2-like isoform X3 n=1 Tax=Eriocheir sinensis TaxID=95602 RepID=UPI0021C852E4|nr:general transcription factor II-I repeat domain-containing protein 2-like isoform X3 [Eriocheir sinensis]
MATAKKVKLDVRSFQSSWTNDFGFIQQNDRAVCALCCENVVCRTSSVKRHFKTKHEKTFKDSTDKAEAIKKAVSRYEKQSNVFKNLSASKNNATEASYKLALCIAKHGKPFTDGDFIKAAFLECSEVLFDGISNKHMIISRIKDMPVSARTVERRISEMAANVSEQQTVALTTTPVFSVALDESVDINDIPRLAVFARYSDTEIHEELCCLKPMYGTTKGEDILKTFTDHFEDRGVDIRKIFAVTTDGAPAMVGTTKSFTKMVEDKIGHPILKLHCIIHQENLCAKISSSDLNKVMATVTKVVNFLVAHSSLTHRQFQAFLEEVDSAYKDIPLHSSVRWLSCGKVLERFVECFDEIKIFLSEKGQDYPELEDRDWTVKLMFLSDITKHLNDLNLILQGAGKTVMDLYDIWKAFVAKLAVYSSDIKTGSFRYFKNLKNLSAIHPVNTTDLQVYMQELKSEFSIRFQDFQHTGPVFSFLIRPDTFKYSELDESLFEWMETEELEMQLIDLQASSLWSAKFKDLRELLETSMNDHAASILSSWTSLPDKFNCMKKVAFALLSAFGSTYQCEQIFSHMRHVLNPHRSKLTTDHSEGCVKLKVSRYSPEISTLAKGKQGQGSH